MLATFLSLQNLVYLWLPTYFGFRADRGIVLDRHQEQGVYRVE
jgi:hypothetical protein